MPFRGDIRTVTVPGCVDGWLALHDRFGRLPAPEVLEPATVYAGGRVPGVAAPGRAAVAFLDGVAGTDELFSNRRRCGPGTWFAGPAIARALEAVAADGRDGFYLGEFGEALLELGRGEFIPDDLARPSADWVDPLVVRAWGHDLWTIPPNSQGYLTLLAAAIADGLDLPDDPDDPAVGPPARRGGPGRRPRPAGACCTRAPATRCGRCSNRTRSAVRRSGIDPRPGRRIEPFRPGTAGRRTSARSTASGWGCRSSSPTPSGFGSHVFVPGHRHRPAEPRHRLLARGRAPGRAGARAPAATHAVTGAGDPARRNAAGGGRNHGRRQPAADPVAGAGPHCSRRGRHRARRSARPRWAIRRTGGTGFDTWMSADASVTVETGAPEAWTDGLRERGHDVVEVESGSAFGHAQLIERHAHRAGRGGRPEGAHRRRRRLLTRPGPRAGSANTGGRLLEGRRHRLDLVR